ncbi:unnamed protein product [Thelazia callipaeda]|uniref:TRAF-type domain-containing protein n=1 Tax=Thelazia callipaeda TaxID=103827 RepID=A0A0N5D0E3_THECL|nr:unnamed protein product [Thelazia callipaeda]
MLSAPISCNFECTNSTDIDDHVHCTYCFRIDCRYNLCTVHPCPECRIMLHACKLEDHLLICPKSFVPCLCEAFGCPVIIRRERMAQHLKHCCAWVIFCCVQWNRRTLSNYAKRKLKRVAKGLEKWEAAYEVDDDHEIDVCAALVDQDVVIDSYRTSRADRKRLTDFYNPCHPLMPLRLSLQKPSSFADEDSSDEENRQKERQLELKRSPFESCYLCKADPGSQHLHVLGNISFEANQEITEDKEITPVKRLLLPPFYEERNLCLNIVRERFSVFTRKSENMPCVQKGVCVYTYFCNENFRRDEYLEHYKLSHMIATECIGRCPLYVDGCPFYYHKMEPCWGKLRYCHYLNCTVLEPPLTPVLTHDGCPVCDLPPLIFFHILQYLDSASLRCLSSTSKLMRFKCFQTASNSAMVHIKWERCESGNWSEKCYMWEFSKCLKPIHEWKNNSMMVLTTHLRNCKFNIPEKIFSSRIGMLPTRKESFLSTVRPIGSGNRRVIGNIINSINS